jgi:uncharacterized protein YaiE (UPF0345 family)
MLCALFPVFLSRIRQSDKRNGRARSLRFRSWSYLAGNDEVKEYKVGESFSVPGNSSFEIEVSGEPYHYVCHFA